MSFYPSAPAYGNYNQISPYGIQYAQTPQQQPQGFAVRAVTGREEAVAAQVDFGGMGTIMPDLGHGVIYLKRFNSNTGSCDIFEFKAAAQEQAAAPQYATLDDLNALRDELLKKTSKGSRKADDE